MLAGWTSRHPDHRQKGPNLQPLQWDCRLGYASEVFTFLGIVQVLIAVVLVLLVLMHSGKDSGLSGAFGVGSGTGPLGGGSMLERNLNRWTIVFAILLFANTIALLKVG
jgi:preprotein translocase subunit SecG